MKFKSILLGLIISFSALAAGPPSFTFKCSNDKTFCVVTLDDKIATSGYYQELLNLLYFTDAKTTIVINLTGFGGYGQGAVALINGMRHSQAKIITNVIGNVQSAHALLAIAGDKTVVSGDGIFMVHNTSGTNMESTYCANSYWQKDRGQWAYNKCIENSKKYNQIYNSIFRDLVKEVLTKEELKRFDEGFEVIITLQELKKRLNNENSVK